MSRMPGGLAARLLGTGMMLGAVVGATWLAGKALEDRVSRDAAANPRLLNWVWARRIAVKLAQAGETVPWGSDAERARARQEYAGHVARSFSQSSWKCETSYPPSFTCHPFAPRGGPNNSTAYFS